MAVDKNGWLSVRRKRLAALLAIVVLIGLPIRVYLAARAAMISRDAAVFIWYAQGLANDPVAEMREQAQHPLYPAMVLAAHGVIDVFSAAVPGLFSDPVVSWQLSALAVTFAGGLVVIVAVYVLAAILFDRRVALIAAALAAAAAEFCQLSADGLTDMPHLSLYLLGLAAGIRGIDTRRQRWLFVAGLLSGLAYLIRPEGAEVAVATVGAALLARRWRARDRIVGVIAVCLAAAVVASPYMLVTGKLVQKKAIGRFLRSAKAPGTPVRALEGELATSDMVSDARPCAIAPYRAGVEGGIVDLARAGGRILENWARSLRVTFLLPAVLWLIRRRDLPAAPNGWRLVAAAAALHLWILIALIIRWDYWALFSLRHVMILAALTLPFSAAGVSVLLGAVTGRWRWGVAAILTVVMVAPTLPWLLETRHTDEAHLRRAGEWIRAHSDGPARVLTTRHRVAFYANGLHLRSPLEANVEVILAEVRARRPDYVVFDERRMLRASASFFDDLQRAIRPGESLKQVHLEAAHGTRGCERAIVYRYAGPP